MPIPTDSITAMSERGVSVIDKVVVDGMGGSIDGNSWAIPFAGAITKAGVAETSVRWRTIEDSDPRWDYDGFTSQPRHWNASGATLAIGQSNCTAQMSFTGTAVQYYAYRSPTSGSVRISLDAVEQGDFDLKTDRDPEGQYYVKVFEAMNLEDTEHTLRIACDSTETQKTIDMLSVIGQN